MTKMNSSAQETKQMVTILKKSQRQSDHFPAGSTQLPLSFKTVKQAASSFRIPRCKSFQKSSKDSYTAILKWRDHPKHVITFSLNHPLIQNKQTRHQALFYVPLPPKPESIPFEINFPPQHLVSITLNTNGSILRKTNTQSYIM